MPYRRKRRSFRRKRGRLTSKSQDVQINISSLWRQIKALRQLINVEKKFFDTEESVNPTTTATLSHISDVAQGDGESTRDGNSCRAVSLQSRIHGDAHASSTVAVQVRLIYFLWNNDSTPVVGDILESTASPLSPLKLNSGMFKVLRDFHASVSPFGSGKPDISKKFWMKLNHKMKYDGTLGSSQNSGAVYRLMLSDATTSVPTVNVYDRLRFIDN